VEDLAGGKQMPRKERDELTEAPASGEQVRWTGLVAAMPVGTLPGDKMVVRERDLHQVRR
jgi:hypothetical protein